MSVELVIVVVILVFFFLLVAEVPVAWCLAGAGALGLLLLRSPSIVTASLGTIPYSATASYSLSIIPMYILLGMFALHGRLAERLYALASRALRGLPGGLGIATVGACAGFAAVTGSSVATAATIGKISIDEMRRFGYPAGFAAGIVAAAGTLGVLIPPSIVLVIYGILANESIARLLVAGIIPGLLSAMFYVAWISVRARSLVPTTSGPLNETLNEVNEAYREANAATEQPRPSGGRHGGTRVPPDPSADVNRDKISAWQSARSVGWISVIIVFVLGGIYTGHFTVIESGALGAVAALIMLMVENRSDGPRQLWRKLVDSLQETANVTSMAFAILVGASVLSLFFVMSGVPTRFAEWAIGLDVPPLMIVVVLLLALIPLGMFLETISVLVIAVPIIHPVVIELGFDGVWFAILAVRMIEIGLVTPPVGMNVFVVSGASGIGVERIFRGVLPLILVDVALVALLIAFPVLVTWLPTLVTG